MKFHSFSQLNYVNIICNDTNDFTKRIKIITLSYCIRFGIGELLNGKRVEWKAEYHFNKILINYILNIEIKFK